MALRRRVDTFTPVARKWRSAPRDIRRKMRDVMFDGSRRILIESRKNAPYLHGALMKAHKLRINSQGGEVSVEITVGGTVTVGGRTVNVDKYVMEMHEGSYNLGPRSRRKAAQIPNTVGRKFLERAYKENIQDLADRLVDAAYMEIR